MLASHHCDSGSIPAWWHSAKVLASHRCDPGSITGSAKTNFGSCVRCEIALSSSCQCLVVFSQSLGVSSTLREVPNCVINPTVFADQVLGHLQLLLLFLCSMLVCRNFVTINGCSQHLGMAKRRRKQSVPGDICKQTNPVCMC